MVSRPMGVGHIAVGLASKRWARNTSLGWLVLAPIFVDLLFSVFCLLGIERAKIVPGITKSIPLDLEYIGVSHSLVTVLGWGLLFALVHRSIYRDDRAAFVLALGVISHFVLDFVSHRPDMPLLPSGPRVGLGLWNYPVPALAVEAAMLLMGLVIYVRTTSASGGRASIPLWLLAAFLFAINAGAYFGPPPPDVRSMLVGNLALVLVVWAFAAIDRRRSVPLTL
jgi:hypothetical protein